MLRQLEKEARDEARAEDKMFKLDEAALNRQFGYRLDALHPSIASRSAAFPAIGFLALLRLPKLPLMQLLGNNQEKLGWKVIFTDQILQQHDEDVIEIILRNIINTILSAIILKHLSTEHSLIVGPLSFDYEAGEVLVGDQIMSGVEVTILTSIKWNQF